MNAQLLLQKLIAQDMASVAECEAMAARLGDKDPTYMELLRDASQYRQSIHRFGLVLAALAAPKEAGDGTPLALILAEVARATAKFPTWPTDPLHAVAVLGEEFGELTKATLQSVYEPHKGGDVRMEAIQTAAMAVRFVVSLDRYEYTRCPQHEQGEAA